jgi:predicted TPR repeat methyltransferase
MSRSSYAKILQNTVKQAIELHKLGKLDDAERRYRVVLRRQPDNPDALHFLGLLLHHRGDSAGASESIRRATVAAPGYADAFNNLGNVLKLEGHFEEAEAAYRQAVQLRPDDANARNNLGVVLGVRGQLADAETELRAAIALDRRHVPAYTNLGHLLKRTGRPQEALGCYRAAIAVDRNNPMALHVLGRLYQANGETDKAREVFRAWLDREPSNPIAQHMLSACSGDTALPRASDGYVRTLFDEIADSFDEHLASLGYRAPSLVGAAVAAAWREPRGDRDVLDAGCGTGLCGAFLRPHARALVGVDLSGGMLRRAKALKVYDELIEAELTTFLIAHPRAYDGVVLADTLCYFGDLQAVFRAAADATRPGGRLFLTVERAAESAGDGYRLQSHGRYSHVPSYVRRELVRAGFDVDSLDETELRQEAGAPVSGLVVTATRCA